MIGYFSRAIPRSISRRKYSSRANEEVVQVKVDDKTGVALVTLNNPPVNSLTLEFLKSLDEILLNLENDKCRGMILASSSKRTFCAGLDFAEIYKPNPKRLKEYWSTFQDVWIRLYGSSFTTAAAINGHCIAGGCVLALTCEYRVMVPNATIGLNETQLGIVPSPWIVASMKNTISERNAEIALVQGKLFNIDQALRIGLVDEVAEDSIDAIKKCDDFISKYATIPHRANVIAKQRLRRKAIQELKDDREGDFQVFSDEITDPNVQKWFEKYFEHLKSKRI